MEPLPAAPAPDGSPTEPLRVLEQWHNGLRLYHMAHNRARTFYRRLGRVLGTTVIVLSSVVGTTIFASLKSSPSVPVQIAAGLLSVAAAATSTLQTFLGYAELADRHGQAALAYGALRRRIDQRLMSVDRRIDAGFTEELRLAWDQADAAAPALPQWLHNRASRLVEAGKRL